ncbi:2OG-Fe oxygenase family [Mycena indigotica]|uniref:2OG-Fe oxygenase family n=1 Tax=Mycena indigotica TaxID=2126181 RepID=A0A8H6SLP5_9AGAR|nr:2OG-Fe oxygenase family [Mycena indigotica]KAF7301918.1 2OG-Fe oxygenase family [Mycena indigotica]
MEPLDGLDDVDWTLLSHAYGPALDVPGLLRRLASPTITADELEFVLEEFQGMFSQLCTLFSSTLAAIPFFLAILHASTTSNHVRSQILNLLIHAIVPDPAPLPACKVDIKALRDRIHKLGSPRFVEKHWQERYNTDDVPDEVARQKHEEDLVWRMEDDFLRLRAYDAIAIGIPKYCTLLNDSTASPRLRAMAIFALAWFPDEIDAIQPSLFDVLDQEQIPIVRATACIALSLLQAPQASETSSKRMNDTAISRRLLALFDENGVQDVIRFSCALGLAFAGIAEEKHIVELLRKVTDKTYLYEHDPRNRYYRYSEALDFPFVFSLTRAAMHPLNAIKGCDHPYVPLALAKALVSQSSDVSPFELIFTTMTIAFDGRCPTKMPPFEELTELQKTVIRALVQIEDLTWSRKILHKWGLPSEPKELKKFTQTEKIVIIFPLNVVVESGPMLSFRGSIVVRGGLKRGLATGASSFRIPLIDFSKFQHGSAEDKKQTADKIVGAFKESGFIYLSNHGIPASAVENAFAKSTEFFRLPSETKDRLAWADPRSNRGYVQIGRERVTQASDAAEIAALRATAPDCKETMEIGRDWDSVWPNQWPAESDAPLFKSTMLSFFNDCHVLHTKVLRAIALGLRLDEGFFEDKIHEQSHNLRLLSYPPIKRALLDGEGQARAGAHSDYGTMTLLFQDDVGGLEAQNPHTGQFVPAAPIPGTIVVNVGDLMQRWSNDVLRSTLHRVVAPPATPINANEAVTRERKSIAFFCNPNFTQEIACLPNCGAPKYPAVSTEEYIVGRLTATYS